MLAKVFSSELQDKLAFVHSVHFFKDKAHIPNLLHDVTVLEV